MLPDPLGWVDVGATIFPRVRNHQNLTLHPAALILHEKKTQDQIDNSLVLNFDVVIWKPAIYIRYHYTLF